MDETRDQAPDPHSSEPLWENDPKAAERILAIDLAEIDQLATYPAGIDWPKERKKLLFLKTALRHGVPWELVAQHAVHHFGSSLLQPFIPVVEPYVPAPFTPPAFDVARQTISQWKKAADTAWRVYLEHVAVKMSEWRQNLLACGELQEFDRRRKSTLTHGKAKGPIADEETIYQWASLYYFMGICAPRPSWAELAEHELRTRRMLAEHGFLPGYKAPPSDSPEYVKAKQNLEEQISTIVLKLLRELGLPLSE